MKKKPEFFVRGRKLYWKREGKEEEISHIRRHTKEGRLLPPLKPVVTVDRTYLIFRTDTDWETATKIRKDGGFTPPKVLADYIYEAIPRSLLPAPKKRPP